MSACPNVREAMVLLITGFINVIAHLSGTDRDSTLEQTSSQELVERFQSHRKAVKTLRAAWFDCPDDDEKKEAECYRVYNEKLGVFVNVCCELYTRLSGPNNTSLNKRVLEELYFWIHVPDKFLPLMVIQYGKHFARHSLDVYLKHVPAKKLIACAEITLIEAHIKSTLVTTRSKIFLQGKREVDHKDIKSSEVIACHVSSGTVDEDGYRYLNFITKSGSVYYTSGCSLTDPKYLLNSIYIIANY